MKTVIIFLLTSLVCEASQFAVRLSDGANGQPPAGYPIQQQPIADDASVPEGWYKWTQAQVDAKKAELKSEYGTWIQSKKDDEQKSDWKGFRLALMESNTGKAILAAPSSNLFSAFTAALADKDVEATDILFVKVFNFYMAQKTQQEQDTAKAELNGLVRAHMNLTIKELP